VKRNGKPRHACAICGHESEAEQMTYSRFTGNRYCNDDDACQRRAKKQAKTKQEGRSPDASGSTTDQSRTPDAVADRQ
jgi:hypothetical protein